MAGSQRVVQFALALDVGRLVDGFRACVLVFIIGEVHGLSVADLFRSPMLFDAGVYLVS